MQKRSFSAKLWEIVFGGWSVSNLAKRFPALDLSATAVREITDALVMCSISIISYSAMKDWGGLSLLEVTLGTRPEMPSFLLFLGIALVLFSVRRICDQRRERIRRVAAEQQPQLLLMRDPLTQLPNRRKFEIDLSAALNGSSNRMTILLLGLAQFKRLHDVYGHLGCDTALPQLA